MKKLVSIALALMLLLASAACAEGAYVGSISNIALGLSSNGQEQSIDLSDLKIDFGMGLADELPTIRLDVTNGDESLLGATMQLRDEDVLFSIDGVDKPFYAPASTSGMGPSMLAGVLENPSSLMHAELPLIPAISIPKFDLMALGEMFGATAVDETTSEFTLPYEMVSSLLSMVSMYKSMIPEAASSVTDSLFAMIDQMIESGSGFELNGTIVDDGTTAELTVNIFLVENSVAQESAAASVVLSSTENQANLDVLLWSGDESYSIGTLTLASNPESATVTFAANIMDIIAMNLSVYQEDGAQIIAFALDAAGKAINASFSYGPVVDGDFVLFALDVPETVGLSISTETYKDSTGVLTFYMNTYGETPMEIALTGDIAEAVQEENLAGIANAADAVSVEEVGDELNAALTGLLGYIGSVMSQQAA